jgi:two-component system sensor histidine kinase PhoQ
VLNRFFPQTLTARVLFLASAVLVVLLGIMALVLRSAYSDSIQAAERAKLQTAIYSLLAAAEMVNGKLFMPENMPDNQLNQLSSGSYAGVLNADGQWIWQSQSALGQNLPVLPQIAGGLFEFQSVSYAAQACFALGYGTTWKRGRKMVPYTFWMVVSQQSFRTQLKTFQDTLVRGFIVIGCLLGLFQLGILRWALRPLKRLSTAIVAVERGQAQQLTGRYPLELQQLVDNMNQLIISADRQRQKIHNTLADLAHSLKTPLAVVRNELYLSELRGDISPQCNQLFSEQTQRMDDIIQYQLRKVARHSGQQPRVIAVKPLIESLIASLQKLYVEKGLQVTLMLDDKAVFVGDVDDLYEIIGNLLDNAFKYAKQQVICRAEQRESLLLVIEDDGQGITDDQYEAVLQRGVRADERVAGQGIGLAVVSELVASYRGQLQLSKSDLGGLKVLLTL